ncbi:MAG: N-acetylglucosamine-6-phosphate deacetylase, partial [Fervidobacterium sp.]
LGMVGAGLYLDYSLEIIADGVHSCNEFVSLVYKIKGPGKIILVTDSISATGLKDGMYSFGEFLVKVKEGKVTLEDGTIFGSTLRYSQAIKNFAQATKCSLKELALVTSYNAAKELGVIGGRIKEGYPAKFVELDDELNIKNVWNF